MDLSPDNHFMSPFFSACLLEQKDHATRIVKGWLQSQGLASAICAPREVRSASRRLRRIAARRACGEPGSVCRREPQRLSYCCRGAAFRDTEHSAGNAAICRGAERNVC